MANITLFFGSFNPIHFGHLSLAKETLRLTQSDEVWFVVSPRSPFKKDDLLIDANHRIEMIKIAISDNEKIKVSDIEVTKNPNSYTVDTLRILDTEYPQHKFSILMGEDNLQYLESWREVEYIISRYKIWVYPRKINNIVELPKGVNIELFNADCINISSTEIREGFKHGNQITHFLPIKVYEYIINNHLMDEFC